MRQMQVVVLEVYYDPLDDPKLMPKNSPAEWDWNSLTGETCMVIATGPDQEVDE